MTLELQLLLIFGELGLHNALPTPEPTLILHTKIPVTEANHP